MAVIDADPNEEYTLSNLSGGTFTYAGSDGFASVSVSDTADAIIDLTNDAIILTGNKGNFSVSIADANQTVVTAAGTGDSAETAGIRVAARSGGIELDAPEGSYTVTFTEADGQEATSSVASSGEGSILAAGPTVEPPKVCGKYKSDYTAEINRSGSGFTFTLASRGDTPVSEKMTAWQATYDENHRMTAVRQLSPMPLRNGMSFSGTAAPEGSCKLFVLDEAFAPVIEQYSLN